jgi:hypothetical protein
MKHSLRQRLRRVASAKAEPSTLPGTRDPAPGTPSYQHPPANNNFPVLLI